MEFKSIISSTCACLIFISYNTHAAVIDYGTVYTGGDSLSTGPFTVRTARFADDTETTLVTDAFYFGNASITTNGISGSNTFDYSQSVPILGLDQNTLYSIEVFAAVSNPTNMPNLNVNFGEVTFNSAVITLDISFDYPFDIDTDIAFFFEITNVLTDSTPSNITNERVDLNDLQRYSINLQNASVVPIPASVWLFCSGIIGLFGLSRRKA